MHHERQGRRAGRLAHHRGPRRHGTARPLPRLDAARRHGRGRRGHPAAVRRGSVRSGGAGGQRPPAPPACRTPARSGRSHRRVARHRLVVPPHHGGRAHARWRARHAVCRQGHENGTARTQGQSADHPQRHQYPRRGIRSSGKGRVRRGRQDPRNQRLHPAAPRGHHPAHAHPQFPERQARMGRRPAVLASRRRRKRPHQRGRHFHRR